jgi:hypothetical protein
MVALLFPKSLLYGVNRYSEFTLLATDPEVRVQFRRYQIMWEVVGLQRGPLSLMSTVEDLLERKISGCGLKTKNTVEGDPPRWLRDTSLSTKFGTNFVDKRRPLGRYSSFANSGHGVSYLEFGTMDKVPEPIGSDCFTP